MSAMSNGEQPDWRRMLTRGERARMLDDIARVSLAAGAHLFPDQPWQDLDVSAGSLITRRSPVERLVFIERVLPLLTQAVGQIGRDPLAAAVTQPRFIAPAFRARRVTPKALLQATRRSPALRSLEETITALSRDTPENRAVKSFLSVLKQDSAAIVKIAEADEEGEAAQRAERCGRSLSGLLRAPWWEEVATEGAAWTHLPSQRAMRRPDYVCVFQEMKHYRAGFRFDWDNPWLSLPPQESWRLYEAWCMFTVLDALGTLGYAPVAEAERGTADLFAVREGRLTFTLAPGSASRVALRAPNGGRLSLVYNQTFAEGRHSLSHTMQPDIALVSDDGLWILDAKFKSYALGGEEGEDINQMHAYRDGIVDEAGRRNVTHAWCLYAGSVDAPNRSHLTYGQPEGTAVGALCLRPGDTETFTSLCALLAGWLRAASPTPARPRFPGT